jgi:hypothetical protein
MAKKQLTVEATGSRFEYRVWGTHRRARKLLEKLADEQTTEQVDDCYVLVDDSALNVKIRDSTLKIKQLVAERKGFEQWRSDRHHSVDTVPTPFDTIYLRLGLDRPQDGEDVDITAVAAAADLDCGVRLVIVNKQRRRFRVGDLRAESTDLTITETGAVLHTLSIEGDDLDQLRALRRRLGLHGHENVAVHNALGLGTDRSDLTASDRVAHR